MFDKNFVRKQFSFEKEFCVLCSIRILVVKRFMLEQDFVLKHGFVRKVNLFEKDLKAFVRKRILLERGFARKKFCCEKNLF